MNITLQVKNSITKLNCPQRQLVQKDQSPIIEQQKGNKLSQQQSDSNKMYLLHNVKNLANTKMLRQSFLIPEYDDPQYQLQECLTHTKLSSLQPLKTAVMRTPLQKPINYLSKKSVNLKFMNDLAKPSKSEDVQKKSIILPKIAIKTTMPPPPSRRPKKKKSKIVKQQEIKENAIEYIPEIYINTQQQEEEEEVEKIDLNYLIRQEDL